MTRAEFESVLDIKLKRHISGITTPAPRGLNGASKWILSVLFAVLLGAGGMILRNSSALADKADEGSVNDNGNRITTIEAIMPRIESKIDRVLEKLP